MLADETGTLRVKAVPAERRKEVFVDSFKNI